MLLSLIDAPAQAGVCCGHGYRLAAGMTGRKHHYFFFVSSLSSLLRLVDCRARSEIIEFEELAKLDLAFRVFAMRSRGSAGPFDRLCLRFDLDQPITRDQVIAQGKRTVEHGTLSSGEFDARALRARLQPRETELGPRLSRALPGG